MGVLLRLHVEPHLVSVVDTLRLLVEAVTDNMA